MSLRSFQKYLFSVLFVVGVMAHVTPVSSQSRSDAPRIENFTFTPSTFTHGDEVELSFDYRNIQGGLAGSTVSLYYEGSLFDHSRKPSSFARFIDGDEKESGTFEVTITFKPRDDPPFEIEYTLRITDAEGRSSNWASATVHYR